MNVNKILDFLNDLQLNNNREWFQKNKSRYEENRNDFESFINLLIPGIIKFDPSIGNVTAGECMFRIYRDIRFSNDKTPYKTHFGAFMAEGGRKGIKAGYYIHLANDESFLGGGLYMPAPEILKAARQEIYYNIGEFKEILQERFFQKYYGGIHDMEDKLKKPPKDFPADFPEIDLLKHKSYAVWHTLAVADMQKETFPGEVVEKFRAMQPFNAFLNRVF
jgi:uncharacterized protein (TIGR02453 family)